MIDFCKIRDIQKGLNSLEDSFRTQYGIGINEGSILCRLYECCKTASELSQCAELKASHTSKTIRSLENKGLIKRRIDNVDKRVMKFVLTSKGSNTLDEIRNSNIEIPEILSPILNE